VSNAPADARRITPEEMLQLLDDGTLYELVDGKLVEKRMSDLAQTVANMLKAKLDAWALPSRLGFCYVEASFRCFRADPDMVRRPDVAYISQERLKTYTWGQAYLTVAPDLAVEVVSPSDQVIDLDRKIADYFDAGVRRVWVLNPDLRVARIYRALDDVAQMIGGADLADPEILPGFRCPLTEVFALPTDVIP